MALFIDIETGTWGNADSLRIVGDEYLSELLGTDSDADICKIGMTAGEHLA